MFKKVDGVWVLSHMGRFDGDTPKFPELFVRVNGKWLGIINPPL
jgi:hypothetical protein